MLLLGLYQVLLPRKCPMIPKNSINLAILYYYEFCLDNMLKTFPKWHLQESITGIGLPNLIFKFPVSNPDLPDFKTKN